MCPEKNFNISSHKEPWMNKDIMELIIDKDKALKQAKKNKSQYAWNEANILRDYVGNLIENAKKDYLEEEIIGSKNDSKRFWRNINTILPNGKTKTKNKISLKNDKGELIEEKDTANYINDFFTNIGPKLAEKFNKNWVNFGEKCDAIMEKVKINKFEI